MKAANIRVIMIKIIKQIAKDCDIEYRNYMLPTERWMKGKINYTNSPPVIPYKQEKDTKETIIKLLMEEINKMKDYGINAVHFSEDDKLCFLMGENKS